jgi:hypothetical protein
MLCQHLRVNSDLGVCNHVALIEIFPAKLELTIIIIFIFNRASHSILLRVIQYKTLMIIIFSSYHKQGYSSPWFAACDRKKGLVHVIYRQDLLPKNDK